MQFNIACTLVGLRINRPLRGFLEWKCHLCALNRHIVYLLRTWAEYLVQPTHLQKFIRKWRYLLCWSLLQLFSIIVVTLSCTGQFYCVLQCFNLYFWYSCIHGSESLFNIISQITRELIFMQLSRNYRGLLQRQYFYFELNPVYLQFYHNLVAFLSATSIVMKFFGIL